jgi:soluble lytic murein transglycosylase-like protein
MQIHKLLKLLFLLVLVILIGRIVMSKEQQNVLEEIEEIPLEDTSGFIVSGSFIMVESPPFYVKPQFLSTKRIVGDYYHLFTQYDWDARLMYAIMMAESGGNPNAINYKDRHKGCNNSYGLMQLSCLHLGKYGLTIDNVFDAPTNIRVSYEIFKVQGLKAWGAYTSGSYKKFY